MCNGNCASCPGCISAKHAEEAASREGVLPMRVYEVIPREEQPAAWIEAHESYMRFVRRAREGEAVAVEVW